MLPWLSRGDLKVETGSEIIAAQDQALQTKYHATRILKTEQPMQTMPIMRRDRRPRYIRGPNIGNRTSYKVT